jgi:hypothetical protein
MIPSSNQFSQPTDTRSGVSPESFASGKYRETSPSATRKVMENSKVIGGRRILTSNYPQEKPHF